MYRLKVGIFKCCTCAKFSPCHCKSKIAARLNLSTQMPSLKIFELRQRFRKLVEYLLRYRIFAGTLYRLKMAKFQMLLMHKGFTLPLQIKYLRNWNLPVKFPPSTSSSWGKDFENWVNALGDTEFLPGQCTGWKKEISNVVHAESFHLAIAKVHYLLTWNFPHICPPSTSSSWSKDFENRFNSIGNIGFFLAQCTG